MIPGYLDSKCAGSVCSDPNCRESVKQGPDGWHITMGHAGFNTKANNGCGYKSEKAARAVVRKYLSPKGLCKKPVKVLVAGYVLTKCGSKRPCDCGKSKFNYETNI